MWKEEEIQLLKEFYPNLDYLLSKLKRTRKAIGLKAFYLGLTKKHDFTKNKKETKFCECGCGISIFRWHSNLTEKRFFKGHENRGRKQNIQWIKNRIKVGSEHWNYKGEGQTTRSKNKGRRLYPRIFEGIRITILHFVSKCQMCMEKDSVLVHHIDENTYNNKFDNLLALCKKCHTKIHRKNFEC